ncbi:threonine dehydratase biosynthetic, chloroplastic-like protein [Tanacetum coccineum]
MLTKHINTLIHIKQARRYSDVRHANERDRADATRPGGGGERECLERAEVLGRTPLSQVSSNSLHLGPLLAVDSRSESLYSDFAANPLQPNSSLWISEALTSSCMGSSPTKLLTVRIIGVEPADANAMALSLHHGKRVILDQVGGFADGVAVKEVGSECFRLCRELIDGVVLVSRDAICASIKDMFEEKRSILEPAGALALAGAEAYCKFYNLKDINVVAITSGANMNFDRLRLVTELANVGRQREAVLATFMPEAPGSFKQFAELIGKMNITEFKYRYESPEKQALVLYRQEALILIMRRFSLCYLTYSMGGRTNVENELLCRFVFPERPGALMKFLHAISPRWNISLFHYRAQGEMGANVLVGIQVSSSELDEFRYHATCLGYEYELETDNEAFQLLMR